MTGPKGGFYSAEDADSLVQAGKPDHREGAFYVWTKDEVDHALGPDRAKVFDYVYGVEAKGNAADSDTSGELAGKNILSKMPLKNSIQMKTKFANFLMRAASSCYKLAINARDQVVMTR